MFRFPILHPNAIQPTKKTLFLGRNCSSRRSCGTPTTAPSTSRWTSRRLWRISSWTTSTHTSSTGPWPCRAPERIRRSEPTDAIQIIIQRVNYSLVRKEYRRYLQMKNNECKNFKMLFFRNDVSSGRRGFLLRRFGVSLCGDVEGDGKTGWPGSG